MTCAQLTTAPAVRLGKHERAILLACWDRNRGDVDAAHWAAPDCATDELPGLILGRAMETYWPTIRYERDVPNCRTVWEDAPDRNRAQATLSRAIRSLAAKGLLDCGDRLEATGHRDAARRTYIKTIRLTRAGMLVAAQLQANVKNEDTVDAGKR